MNCLERKNINKMNDGMVVLFSLPEKKCSELLSDSERSMRIRTKIFSFEEREDIVVVENKVAVDK